MTATPDLDRPSASAIALDALTARIEAARRHASLHALIRAALWGLCAGLAAFCAARLATHLGFATIEAVPTGFAIGIAAAIAAAAVLFLRRPDSLAVARRADAALGTGETFSTALEQVRSRSPAGPLQHLLFSRANSEAPHIAPDLLFPRRIPREAFFALILALASLALIALLPAKPAAPPPAAPDPVLSAQEQSALATEIETIALSFASDAQDRSDPYLAAVAGELMSVSRELSQGTRSDRAALVSQLDQLRGHAAAGYAEPGPTPAALPDRSSLLDPVIEAARAPAPPASATLNPAARQAERAGEGSLPTPAPRAAEDDAPPPAETPEPTGAGPAAPSQRNPGAMPEPMLSTDSPCLIDGDESCMVEGDTNYLTDRAAPIATTTNAPAGGATPGTGEPPQNGEAMLMGPATQSGLGETTQAGRGTEALMGEDPGDALAALGEHLVLSSERRAEDGAQTRIDRAPTPEQYEITALPPADTSAWRQTPEAPWTQNTLPPSRRDVLTRYFTVE